MNLSVISIMIMIMMMRPRLNHSSPPILSLILPQSQSHQSHCSCQTLTLSSLLLSDDISDRLLWPSFSPYHPFTSMSSHSPSQNQFFTTGLLQVFCHPSPWRPPVCRPGVGYLPLWDIVFFPCMIIKHLTENESFSLQLSLHLLCLKVPWFKC